MTVVVGTAGHIDHGKTTLLHALTGIDADRLPEERRRGMTIDVGYAHLPLPDGSELDFVDVPGHERLVGNMLVGAGEIDAALLVVAADDGPRAQTLEHLVLLDALGIRHGVAVVTKVDLLEVDDPRRAALAASVAGLLAGTTLAGSPVVLASATSGEGLDALRAALVGLRDRVVADAGPPGPPRLAIDRVFTVRGRGVVVTGSLRGGMLARGGALRLVPGDLPVRVREIQVHGRSVEGSAAAGRVALNLAGLERTAVSRGVVLAGGPEVVASDRLLVALRPPVRPGDRAGSGPGRPPAQGAVVAGDATSWPPVAGARVRLHLGTDQVGAVIRRSKRDVAGLPGNEATAILRLDRPVAVAPGGRFALRRPSPGAVAAGGRVLDPVPPVGVSWRRATAGAVAALAVAVSTPDRLAALLTLHGTLSRTQLAAIGAGWPPAPTDVATDGAGRARLVGGRLVASALGDAGDAEALARVAAVHAARPDAPGVALAELRSEVAGTLRRLATLGEGVAAELATGLIESLVAAGLLARSGDVVSEPGHRPDVPAGLAAAMDRLQAALAVPAPPGLAGAARAAGCPPEGIRTLEAAGRIVRIDRDLAWSASTYHGLVALALQLATPGPLTPAALRDATGTSRKYVMAILEDLDRRGALRRTDEGHVRGPRAARD